ncbi:MAG: hypothetical protein WCG45_01970 [bacterium]
MKKILTIIALAFSISGCHLFRSTINGEKINVDQNTYLYTFKENGQKVTGTVIFYELDPKTGKKYKKSFREVIEGKRANIGYDYYPSGSIVVECPFDGNGLITGTVKYYYESGQLSGTAEFKDNKTNGTAKGYNKQGIQDNETIFEAGIKIKEYDFDENGKKIIPAIEKLELVEYKTGFYEYVNYNNNQILYQPILIMKWKNISSEPISKEIKMEALFIDNKNGEEWSQTSSYFQGYSDAPLQVGLSRQLSLQSSVGYKSAYGIENAEISCQIIINKLLYKTVKIQNVFLNSNIIQ